MANQTAIGWTDLSWNPVHGCSKVSPGCARCYAETLSRRRALTPKPWTPEDLCPECVASLRAEVERLIAALPQRIGLCPDCAPEFYYPLADGEDLDCPTPECSHTLVVYARESFDSERERALREAAAELFVAYDDWAVNSYPADGDSRHHAEAWFSEARRVDQAVEKLHAALEATDG